MLRKIGENLYTIHNVEVPNKFGQVEKIRRKDLYEFIGQDGSLGLKSGAIYVIKKLETNIFTGKTLAYIQTNMGEIMVCPYSSKRTFNKNWKRI